MNSNTGRVAVGIAAVAVAVLLLVVLRDDGSSTDAEAGGEGGSKVTTIAIENGKPVGGIAELTYSEGERVRFKVDSDTADEVHLHGYDIAKDVRAGGSVTFDFPATIEGVFEAELEDQKEQILQLTVTP